jgi:hypothetical protein
VDSPGLAPIVTAPDSLSDYREAVSKSDKNLLKDLPNITAAPSRSSSMKPSPTYYGGVIYGLASSQ